MKYECLRPQDLSPTMLDRWRELLSARAEYSSPFFHPEFSTTLAEFQPSIEVCVGSRDGQRPCDLEGPVYDANFPWNATQMMRQCRLRAWQFRHRAIYSDEASASRAVSFTTWICHKG